MRNAPTPLDAALVRAITVDDESAVARAAALEIPGAGSRERSERLRAAVRTLDLTSLTGDETPERVRSLCADALRPLGAEPVQVAAVCLLREALATAREALAGTSVRVACATGDFPAAGAPLSVRLAEIRAAVAAGAQEIDAVVAREAMDAGAWESVYDEVRALRDASGAAALKAILRTGDRASLTDVARASRVALMAGAEFIKTSTGRERVNATLPAGIVMAGQIREHRARTGLSAGLKPAGGVRTADDALHWTALARAELGADGQGPEGFRIGASALLADVRRELGAQPR